MCETQTTKPKRCGKYSFKLVGKHKTYFKDTTIADFTPFPKTKKIQKRSILPTYNNDKKFWTPAFLIPSLPLEQDEVLINQHSKRMKENTTEISQILVPKPRSRQKYCAVCRDYYEEYLDHVRMQKHKEKLRNNIYQGYIIEATQMFKQQNEWIEPQLQKQNSLETSLESACYSNEQDLVQACLNLA